MFKAHRRVMTKCSGHAARGAGNSNMRLDGGVRAWKGEVEDIPGRTA